MVKLKKVKHEIDYYLNEFSRWQQEHTGLKNTAQKKPNTKGKEKSLSLASLIAQIEKHSARFVENAVKQIHTPENEMLVRNFTSKAQTLLAHVHKTIAHPGKFAAIKENLQSLVATFQEALTKLANHFKGVVSLSHEKHPSLTPLRNTAHLSREESRHKASLSKMGNTIKQQVTKRQNIP